MCRDKKGITGIIEFPQILPDSTFEQPETIITEIGRKIRVINADNGQPVLPGILQEPISNDVRCRNMDNIRLESIQLFFC